MSQSRGWKLWSVLFILFTTLNFSSGGDGVWKIPVFTLMQTFWSPKVTSLLQIILMSSLILMIKKSPAF